jgi:hypothetical protein
MPRQCQVVADALCVKNGWQVEAGGNPKEGGCQKTRLGGMAAEEIRRARDESGGRIVVAASEECF